MHSGSEERSDSSDSASFYSVIDKDSKFGSLHSLYSVEYHKRESPHCSDRSVFQDCVELKESKENIISDNPEINTVNVIMSDNSELKPKGEISLSKETAKKKKSLFSFRKKGSKKDKKDPKNSGTDSDLSSSNSATPQVTPQDTPQGTLEKNSSAPWKNENSEESKGETTKFIQVSGKEKQKKVTSFLSLKKEKNIKPLVQSTKLSKLESESEETRNDNRKNLTPENSTTKLSDDETVPDRKPVVEDEITRILSNIDELVFSPVLSDLKYIEEEDLTPDTMYTSFHTLQNERFDPLNIKGIDIAEGPHKHGNSNLEKSKIVSTSEEKIQSISQEIAEAEKVNEIKTPLDNLAPKSLIKFDKISSPTREDTKPVAHPEVNVNPSSLSGSPKEESVQSVEATTREKVTIVTKHDKLFSTIEESKKPMLQPSVEMKPSSFSESSKESVPSADEVTTRKKVTLVTMSGKTKETDSFDSISTYPRIGTKVKSSSIVKVQNNLVFNSNGITNNKNADHLNKISVALNQKRKTVSLDSVVKSEVPKTNDKTLVRVPQPLTNDHYAPFGKAIIKPKIPNDRTFSHSFSYDISEIDGDIESSQTINKSNLSYSNLYVNATEARSETDEASNTSGRLSDSWVNNFELVDFEVLKDLKTLESLVFP